MSGHELVFLDSSVVIHAAGSIGYTWAATALQAGARGDVSLVTDALSVQEVEDSIADMLDPRRARLASDVFRTAVERILPVTAQDLALARDLARQHPQLSPRECLHLAVIQNAGIPAVCAVLESGYVTVPSVRSLTLLEDLDRRMS